MYPVTYSVLPKQTALYIGKPNYKWNLPILSSKPDSTDSNFTSLRTGADGLPLPQALITQKAFQQLEVAFCNSVQWEWRFLLAAFVLRHASHFCVLRIWRFCRNALNYLSWKNLNSERRSAPGHLFFHLFLRPLPNWMISEAGLLWSSRQQIYSW